MIEVRNTLFQPLTFHLAKGPTGMQEGLHLGPRERRRIRQDQLSPEIEKAAGRGLIALVYLPDESAVNTAVQPDAEAAPGESGADQSPVTSRKRR